MSSIFCDDRCFTNNDRIFNEKIKPKIKRDKPSAHPFFVNLSFAPVTNTEINFFPWPKDKGKNQLKLFQKLFPKDINIIINFFLVVFNKKDYEQIFWEFHFLWWLV